MKETNIISLLDASNTLSAELFNSYKEYHSINIKSSELNDLALLVDQLKLLTKNIESFDKYFVGYTIPQIGKEFDLLRFDSETIVNIELKSSSTTEKIQTQLRRNKYYLSFLKLETHLFTYVSSTNEIYCLDEFNNLIKTNFRQLIEKIVSQNVKSLENIDKYFNPANYLVSPFNSTQEFIREKYFLTVHQEKIRKDVLTELSKPTYSIISIKGKAGTGKTLLTYDIAKQVYKTKEVIIVHCGYLNAGQRTLRDDYSWKIIPAKEIANQKFSKYDLIVIDEAQRIYKNQLKLILEEVKKTNNNCIFSYDSLQTLRRGEIQANIALEIEKQVTLPLFELTTKIRTNKEVANFIQCLFNSDKTIHKLNYSNIELKYFGNYKNAKKYLIQLKSENWKVINYTPSGYQTHPYEEFQIIDESENDNAHTVIGQEYDNVVAVIDEYFYYKKDKLSTKNYASKPYYHPTKMLFQIVSRTKIKLSIVIINNSIILNRCLEIMNKNTST